MMFRLLYYLGVIKRNPSLFKYYRFLKETEKYSLEELQKLQISKCKEILVFAGNHSPYYQKLFKEIDFDPNDFSSLEDLKKIPTITKKELIQDNEEIHTIKNYSFSKLFFCETSGTSGEVLKFYRDEYWDSANRASVMRGYSWFGVNLWDKNGYFWGYNIDEKSRTKTSILDFIQNRFRLFSYNKDGIKEFIKKLNKATYLHGYSSMIYEVAKIINKEKIDTSKINLKLIKGTSEKIYDSYHPEVIKAFGSKIVSEYGAAESGIIAFECPEGHMHIFMENVIVEVEEGEIIITNLNAKSFPIIRYKLGDFVKLSDEKCDCGLQHPIIEEVMGRVGKKIYGKENIYPSLTFYYVFKNIALGKGVNLNYQAVQKEKGKLIIKIEQELDKETKGFVELEMSKYFSDDIDYAIEDNQELHVMEGKLKDFISEID